MTSVEADLSQRVEQKELAETTHAWLLTLWERLEEVEEDTEEAFRPQATREAARGGDHHRQEG